jgi:NitT/TauT family transport system ATP-binding protein
VTLRVDIQRKAFHDRGGHAHIALAGLQMQLRSGEFVCLVGPSGCGKSTLLNMIAGLDEDFEGAIVSSGASNSARGGSGIGYVFQEPRLMPWLSVLDNVLLVAGESADAVVRRTQRDRAIALLQAMELGDVLDAWPGSLSGGMQRRVALARGFMNRPNLLLMDEPFVSLDAPTAMRLREMLLRLWQEDQTTVLFVTHDVREALALGDRVCFLSAAPARLMLEKRIDVPRPRRLGDLEVMLGDLLATHPELLAGLPGRGALGTDGRMELRG